MGPIHLWNFHLPQWIREGTADYIGLAGDIDVVAMYAQYHAHHPFYRAGSGHYDRFRLLVAFYVKTLHWPIEKLLLSKLTMEDAERTMNARMQPVSATREKP